MHNGLFKDIHFVQLQALTMLFNNPRNIFLINPNISFYYFYKVLRIKILLLSISADELLSRPNIITFFSNLPFGKEKVRLSYIEWNNQDKNTYQDKDWKLT